MVNFGGYVRAIRDGENKGTHLYLICYNDIKQDIYHEDLAIAERRELFAQHWMSALEEASSDLAAAVQQMWESVFAVLNPEDARGAPPAASVEQFFENATLENSRNLLTRLKQLHTAAVTNAEGLRKLVKKFDKYHHKDTQEKLLSASLLPLLYSSNVFSCQAMLEDSITILRDLIHRKDTFTVEEEDDDNSFTFLPMSRMDSERGDARTIANRMREYNWLKRMIASIPEQELQHLVAHRGFHHVGDRNDKRPLENSLSAYETAWTSGIYLCECDIALTKDEKLVLAHDDDFQRLALDSKAANSTKRVSDLTFQELLSMPLKSGLRPPLLMDVLRSAHAISGERRLIIEIKPGNQAAASALARLLWRHPDLCEVVEMIMSFDVFVMHKLREELNTLQRAAEQQWNLLNQTPVNDMMNSSCRLACTNPPLSHHRRLLSYDHFGTAAPTATLVKGHHHHQLSYSNLLATITPSASSMDLWDEKQSYDTPEQDETTRWRIPKLMLLTVFQQSKIPCELQVSVTDLSSVDSWLSTDTGSLDGIYFQFEQAMMSEQGAETLRKLKADKSYLVGVWGASGRDPDNYETFQWLVNRANVDYVNSDLPNRFKGVV